MKVSEEEQQKITSAPLAVVPYDNREISVALRVQNSISEKLNQKTPVEYTYTREGPGGKMLTYTPWGYVCRVLDEVCGPAWSHEYTTNDIIENELDPLPAKPATKWKPAQPATRRVEIQVTATLITPWGRHTATAGHLYYPSNANQLRADAIQSAASKALTRAAARIGIGLDLRLHDRDDDEVPSAADAAAEAVGDDFLLACEEFGLTDQQAIALLSETLAGDQNALQSLADIMEAGEYVDASAVAAALKAAVESITQDEEPAPKKKAPTRKAK